MNGVLNFSILDGWWIEGFNGENGFAIGERGSAGDDAQTDRDDAESLYSTLEQRIIPAFYNRNASGMPGEWMKMMKNALATLTPLFSSERMVSDYVEKIYRSGK
jgi:starch phosphorylase